MLRLNPSDVRGTSSDRPDAAAVQLAAQTSAHESSNFASLLRQSQLQGQSSDADSHRPSTARADRTPSGAAPTSGKSDPEAAPTGKSDPGAAPAGSTDPAGGPAATSAAAANAAPASQAASPSDTDPAAEAGTAAATGLNQALAARKLANADDAAAARRQVGQVGTTQGQAPGGTAPATTAKGVKIAAGGLAADPALNAWQANLQPAPALAATVPGAADSVLPGTGAAAATAALPQALDAGNAAQAGTDATTAPSGGPGPAVAPTPFAALLNTALAPAHAGAPAIGGAGSVGEAAALAAAGGAATAPAAAASNPSPTSVHIEAPVTSPAFTQNLGLQLSMLARNGVQHAELHLNPADMGPVSVQIVMNGTQAQVNFGADLAATRHAIEAGIPELASALRDAGFTLSGGGVSQHSSGRSDSSASDNPASTPARRAASSEAVASVHAAAQRLSSTGGVDLFA